MPLRTKNVAILLSIVVAGTALFGCLGRTHTITMDATTARLEFGVVAVQLEAGDGTIVDFCVVLNDSICGFPGGEVLGCGLDVPTSSVQVFCADPILAQWPDSWTFTSGTWAAPSISDSGTLIVEPAWMYVLPSGAGIINDPGYSAYVLRLDRTTNFGPADVEFTLEFEHGNDTQVVLKAVEVMVAELQAPLSGKVLLPLGDPVIDFPNLPPDHSIFTEPVATAHSTWGEWKALFK